MRTLNGFELVAVAGGIEGGGGDTAGSGDNYNGADQASLMCNAFGGVTGVAVAGLTANAMTGVLAGVLAQQMCEVLTAQTVNPNGTNYGLQASAGGASQGYGDGNWGCN